MNLDELRSIRAPSEDRCRESPEAALITLNATGRIGEGAFAIGLLLCWMFLLEGCASGTKSKEDPRLNVQAAMSQRSGRPSAAFLYVVWIRNVSDETLFIRRVEVDPIGGGQALPAYDVTSKRIEPGEEIEVRIWAELVSKETVLGIGDSLARVVVAFDDGAERVMGTYLVELK